MATTESLSKRPPITTKDICRSPTSPCSMSKTEVKSPDDGHVEHDVAVGSTYIPDLNDKAMERRVVRKIDRWILPFICISYLINFLDRVRRLITQRL